MPKLFNNFFLFYLVEFRINFELLKNNIGLLFSNLESVKKVGNCLFN